MIVSNFPGGSDVFAVPLDGSKEMTGDLKLGGNQIKNIGAPEEETDAARKQEVTDHNKSEEAHTDKFSQYLPLSGGTIEGSLTIGKMMEDNVEISSGKIVLFEGLGIDKKSAEIGRDYPSCVFQTGPDTSTVNQGSNKVAILLPFLMFDPAKSFNGYIMNCGGMNINNIGYPEYFNDAASKGYVDTAITAAIGAALEASY